MAQQRRGLARAGEVGRDRAVRRQPAHERRERLRLLAAALGQRRIGLPLHPPLGVPGRLTVADEDETSLHAARRYPDPA
jgi:hypothetical protein